MSNKTYGKDDNGTYITWTSDNEKVIHKKYISGPLEGDHTGHDSRTNKDFWAGSDSERKKDRDSSSSSSKSSGCYIATATLNGNMDIRILDPLKEWRYSVLENNSLGQKLSSYYRHTASDVAKQIEKKKTISFLLRNTLVLPSVWMATQRKSASITFVYDLILWAAFLTGLATMHVIRWFTINK